MPRNRRFGPLLGLVALPALAVGGSPQAGAQVLRGTVVEVEAPTPPAGPKAGAPVVGAEVALLGGDGRAEATALTDSLGAFVLAAPRGGSYGLRVTHPAYRPHEARGVEVGTGETVVIEVRLSRSAIPLEPLVVTARMGSALTGFEGRRLGGGLGTYLTREDIDARAASKTTDLLRGIPGVSIEFERWGVGSRIEMRNAFGNCEPAVFADGIRLPLRTGSRLDDVLTPERIEAVEVYTSLSGAPAQYISGHCGVILLWTRRGDREGGEPWHWKRVLLGLGVAVGLILWIK